MQFKDSQNKCVITSVTFMKFGCVGLHRSNNFAFNVLKCFRKEEAQSLDPAGSFCEVLRIGTAIQKDARGIKI